MLQSLLEERFALQIHRETKDIAGYGLVLAKTGPKLTADSGVAKPFVTYPGGLEGAPGTLDTLASMLARNDVVDVKGQTIDKGGKVAILASVLSSLPDFPNNVLVHEGRRFPSFVWRASRALDCMTASRFPTCR